MSISEGILVRCAEAALHRVLVSVRTQQHLLNVPERVLRRIEVLFPANMEEQQAALYWMGPQGDEDDAALLAAIPRSNVLCSPALLDSTRQKLLARLGPANVEVQELSLSAHLVKVAEEILPGIRDGVRNLLNTSQVGRSQWLNADTTPLATLQYQADIALRRLQYLFPVSLQDYEATLRWFRESGAATELALLFAVPPPSGSTKEIHWLHQAAQKQILDRLLNCVASNDREFTFRKLVSFGTALRSTLGPRGSVAVPAARRISEQSAAQLFDSMDVFGLHRNDLILTLGEWGGNEDAMVLCSVLDGGLAATDDEDYGIHLASALANIGGPDAVEGLLRAAENASERVRLVALSGLESLATAGALALTEYPEPVVIDSEEMRAAYLELAERLRKLVSASETPSYVRHKASELLETIELSLSPAT